MTTVSTVTALIAALKGAGVGAVVTLAPGAWSNVVIDGVEARGVTINGPGAVLHDLTLERSSGITFSGLEFSTVGYPVGPFGAKATYPFHVNNDHDITFTGLNVHGDPAGSLATDVSAFHLESSPHTTFSHNVFSYLHAAVVEGNSDYFTFTANQCHHNRDDCVDNAGSSWVTITNNQCYSNHPNGVEDGDHPDCIQFWTRGEIHPQRHIDIEGNTYVRGSGNATQFIFMRANYPAPYNLPFEDVTIKNNTAKGSSLQAIGVDTATQVDIENNTITPYCTPTTTTKSWINTTAVKGLKLMNNSAAHYISTGSTDITQANNALTQCVPTPRPDVEKR